MTQTVVLVHGRHVATKGWETLVWGHGNMIGTAPLGLALAYRKGAALVFGTGASMKDGLNECAYTQKYLLENIARITEFSEFAGYSIYDSYERESFFAPIINGAHLDDQSVDTVTEIKNAVCYAKSIGANELIQVTSPFHSARCMSISAKLLEDGYDFGGVTPMVVSSRSSTAKCRAATTVILEHPHRGDDPMINSPLAPHEVFPRMFKLIPSERTQFFCDIDLKLTILGK